MSPQEPYWRTNISFSPPLSRWDFHFQPEGLSFGSNEGSQLYGSSTTSNSSESRSWLRGNHLTNQQYDPPGGTGQYFSIPSDISPARQWTPPIIQEISVADYATSSRRVSGHLSFSPAMEGISATQDSVGSTSSQSDSRDYDSIAKSLSHRSHSFMSKPVHPLSIPSETHTRETADPTDTAVSEFNATTNSQIERPHFSGDGDSTDFSDPIESDIFSRTSNVSDGVKCGLCERFLSQRSPWSSQRIVRSGDMPVAGVLSCHHVFHAECLEQMTPRTHETDPPCPLCVKSDDENNAEQRFFSRLRNGIPRIRPFHEYGPGPSKPWGCAKAVDCFEAALHAPPRNTMLLLNCNRIKKNLYMKGKLGKEFPGKLRKSGIYSSQLFIGSVAQERVVSGETAGSSSMK